jgi:hypothetical protein
MDATRRRRTAAVAVTLLAVLGACGRPARAPGRPGLSVVSVAEARAGHLRSVPWTLIGSRPGGRDIRIGYSFGGCQPRPVAVATTADRTTVTLTLVAPAPDQGLCSPTLRPGRGHVRLPRPLAGRHLRHAAVAR